MTTAANEIRKEQEAASAPDDAGASGAAAVAAGVAESEPGQISAREIDGLKKAAIFLVALDEDVAAEVLRRLSDREAKVLSREIARLESVDASQLRVVLDEFQEAFRASGVIRGGGAEHAFKLLERSFPPETARRIMQLVVDDDRRNPFDFLASAEVDTLYPYLQEEHPQTIALVLSFLDAERAASVLRRLPPERRTDVVRRIATIDHTSPEVIQQVEQGLRKHLASLPDENLCEVGGTKICAQILNVLDRETEKSILEAIEGEDQDLSESIRQLMFVFEDILRVDDRGIQAVLKEVDNKQLALALKSATPELKGKIFKNMSQRAAESVQEEIDFLGPVRLTDVQEAQQSIVEIVRRLEEAGDLVIAGHGGGGDLVE